MDPICNVCRKPITDPNEQGPRYYMIVSTGHVFSQFKHDACHALYMANKTGLVAADAPIATSKVEKGVRVRVGKSEIVAARSAVHKTLRQLSATRRGSVPLGVAARAKIINDRSKR